MEDAAWAERAALTPAEVLLVLVNFNRHIAEYYRLIRFKAAAILPTAAPPLVETRKTVGFPPRYSAKELTAADFKWLDTASGICQ